MTGSEPTTGAQGRIYLSTRFGEFEVEERDVLTFPEGLPGFERLRRFVVLTSASVAPLQCLASVDDAAVSFLAVDPRMVEPAYRVDLEKSDLDRLGAAEGGLLLWLAVIVADDADNLAVNLQAPIVINPARMTGCQVLPRSASIYSLRHRLPLD